MDIVNAVFEAHNRHGKCECPTCGITRLCEEMRVMAEETMAYVEAFRADRPTLNVRERV